MDVYHFVYNLGVCFTHVGSFCKLHAESGSRIKWDGIQTKNQCEALPSPPQSITFITISISLTPQSLYNILNVLLRKHIWNCFVSAKGWDTVERPYMRIETTRRLSLLTINIYQSLITPFGRFVYSLKYSMHTFMQGIIWGTLFQDQHIRHITMGLALLPLILSL